MLLTSSLPPWLRPSSPAWRIGVTNWSPSLLPRSVSLAVTWKLLASCMSRAKGPKDPLRCPGTLGHGGCMQRASPPGKTSGSPRSQRRTLDQRGVLQLPHECWLDRHGIPRNRPAACLLPRKLGRSGQQYLANTQAARGTGDPVPTKDHRPLSVTSSCQCAASSQPLQPGLRARDQ